MLGVTGLDKITPDTRKRCGWLLVSLLVTLTLTLGLELVVIGPLLESDRPPTVQFFQRNQPINAITLSPGSTTEVSVLISPGTAATAMQIFVSNQTVVNAIWLVPGQDMEISARANGQSQALILGPGYGVSYVTLASLQVTVAE
jgi:hypothetical protein